MNLGRYWDYKEQKKSPEEALDTLLHLDSYGEDRKDYMQELGNIILQGLKAYEVLINYLTNFKDVKDILEWVKHYDEVNDTCYYEVLKEIL